MKEVLTKSFWQGVKKTFHEALEEPSPRDNASSTPAEVNPKADSTSETPSSSSATSEQG
jgi:hypothetical protein